MEAVERSPQLQQRCSCSLHVTVPSNSRKSFTVVKIHGEIFSVSQYGIVFPSQSWKNFKFQSI